MTTNFTSGQPVENIEEPSSASIQGTELSYYSVYSLFSVSSDQHHYLLSEKTKKKLPEGASLAWHGFKLFAESTEIPWFSIHS